jgi:polyisoprenoid-binding protein YceI
MAKWVIDPDHSVAAFIVRHMMVANVRGQFNKISGTIVFDPDTISLASVEVSIDVSGIYTGISKRDDHLRSPDFFDAAKYPAITFRSTSVEPKGGTSFRVTGELTIKDITRTESFNVEYSNTIKSPFGGEISRGFAASLSLNRQDFGVSWNVPIEGRGFVVGNDVRIMLDVEADLQEE